MNQIKTATYKIRKLKILTFLKSSVFRYQHTLILLLFVSATLIFLDLSLFSASFIFGASLIVLTLMRRSALLKPRGIMWLLFAFLPVALLSWIFSEIELTGREIRLYIQTIYWFLLAVIIYNLYPFLDKQKLSKYIFFSTLLLLGLYVSGFRVGLTQNGVAFTVIIIAPLSFFFLRNIWLKILFAGILVFLILLNGSRSGAVISFGQSLLIILFSLPAVRKYMKTILVAAGILMVLFTTETTLSIVGEAIYPINPRMGELLTNTEYVLRNDMSWLQRQAQIQKGKQIFAEHPVLGIGYTNFVAYDIEIDESKIEADRRLKNIDNRSSHNTYVSWLAETGALGFGIMVLFFLYLLIRFWRNLHLLPDRFESGLLISFLGMLIYFYTIAAQMGTSTWIMYGIIAGGANALSAKKSGIKTKKLSK